MYFADKLTIDPIEITEIQTIKGKFLHCLTANLAVLTVLLLFSTPSFTYAATATATDALVTKFLVHGSYYDSEAIVVYFNKSVVGSTCKAVWINTVTRQGDRAFRLLHKAFIHGHKVTVSVDTSSLWKGGTAICEFRHAFIYK